MDAYGALSAHYDILMGHVDYRKWLIYATSFLPGADSSPVSILDLGCGTGTGAKMLVDWGYDVIAVDSSVDMLTVARQKTDKPLFLCQDFCELDLYGTVRGAICLLDCLNYLLDEKLLLQALKRVCLFLEPGCSMVFDVHSPQKLAALNGRDLVNQSGDVFCVWRHIWREPVCIYNITVFEKQGRNWQRYDETHKQRAYSIEEIFSVAQDAGFKSAEVYEHLTRSKPKEDTERYFFVCTK